MSRRSLRKAAARRGGRQGGCRRWAVACLLAGCLAAAASLAGAVPIDSEAPTPAPAPPLQFQIDEGPTHNAFFQQGPVAAHLLLTSGTRPRLLVAFPAGNSGVGAWFVPSATPVQWTLQALQADHALDDPALHGIVADVTLQGGGLELREAVLGSVRILRDYQLGQPCPTQLETPAQLQPRRLLWQRKRLDGAPGYRLELALRDGHFEREQDRIRLLPDHAGTPVRMRLRAASGDTPLTPFASTDALLDPSAGADPRMRDALRFLSYHEKLLAGSWRFDTYFGRDTLMSVRLLMPVLRPAVVEAGLGAVLARISPAGEVAHEEDIGEFAVLRHRQAGDTASDAPLYDYGMIDGDYMLAPVLAAWLLEDPRGRASADTLLAGDAGRALVRNLMRVAEHSAGFAADPRYPHLLALKPGRQTGQWRDSNEGLGRGRYPYDVNVVWMPAALRAIDGLLRSGLLDAQLDRPQRQALTDAAARADAWETHAATLFAVRVPAAQAAAQVRAYAARAGVPAEAALRSLGAGGLDFAALALDAAGKPIAVVHSDEGFELLFGQPDTQRLARDVAAMMRPFPAGLMTDVGMLVANPAFAEEALQARFGASAYHGTVVWAWQQAVMAAGLRRQLQRTDLPAPLRMQLQQAQARLWQAIQAAGAVRTSELWSWTWSDGRYQVEPFGAEGGHEDESNAAQLWSTVMLALSPPARP